jgi:hypothetical protein
MVFSLAQHHKYSISEIEGLIPYERDLYVDMLMEFLDKQRQEIESRKK